MVMANCEECGDKIPMLEIKLGDIETCKRCDLKAHKKRKEEEALAHKKSKEEEAAEIERDRRISEIPFITSDSFASHKTIKTLGTARGATVRAKHLGSDIAASLKNMVGGEIKGYTSLLVEGREEAIRRMRLDADSLGANAIVSVRFSTSMIEVGAVEVMAYGTAIVTETET